MLGEMKRRIKGEGPEEEEETTAEDARSGASALKEVPIQDIERCWFGHKANARRANGRVNWYKNPWPTMWYAVESGRPLCSQCYHTALRQRKKGLKPALPTDYEQYPDSDYNLTKHLVKGGVRQNAGEEPNGAKRRKLQSQDDCHEVTGESINTPSASATDPQSVNSDSSNSSTTLAAHSRSHSLIDAGSGAVKSARENSMIENSPGTGGGHSGECLGEHTNLQGCFAQPSWSHDAGLCQPRDSDTRQDTQKADADKKHCDSDTAQEKDWWQELLDMDDVHFAHTNEQITNVEKASQRPRRHFASKSCVDKHVEAGMSPNVSSKTHLCTRDASTPTRSSTPAHGGNSETRHGRCVPTAQRPHHREKHGQAQTSASLAEENTHAPRRSRSPARVRRHEKEGHSLSCMIAHANRTQFSKPRTSSSFPKLAAQDAPV